MLAYSSIAHAGYMLLAVIAMKNQSFMAILLYTAAYSFATITAFTVLIMMKSANGNDAIENFNGLSKKSPFVAFAITLSMLSLAGIPVTAGFFAKYYIFSTVISEGHTWLVVIAILNSAIGVFYYFRIIIAVYFKQGEANFNAPDIAYKTVLIITAIATLLLGILPGLVIDRM